MNSNCPTRPAQAGATKAAYRRGRAHGPAWLCAFCLGIGANSIGAEPGHHHPHHDRVTPRPAAQVAAANAPASAAKLELPPLPARVAELKFSSVKYPGLAYARLTLPHPQIVSKRGNLPRIPPWTGIHKFEANKPGQQIANQ